MERQQVLVLFDQETGKAYKYLLEAWDERENFEYVFFDEVYTPGMPDTTLSDSLFHTLGQALCSMVIISRRAPEQDEQPTVHTFDISVQHLHAISRRLGKTLLAVRVEPDSVAPDLSGDNVLWIYGFDYSTLSHTIRRLAGSSDSRSTAERT